MQSPPSRILAACSFCQALASSSAASRTRNTFTTMSPGECVPLPSAGKWELDTDEAGLAFIFIDGTEGERWLPDVFSMNVYGTQDEMYIASSIFGTHPIPLKTFEERHVKLTVGLRSPCDTSVSNFRVYNFSTHCRGKHFGGRLHKSPRPRSSLSEVRAGGPGRGQPFPRSLIGE